MGREHLTYHLVSINYQFSNARFKANASIFYLKNRKNTFFNVIQLQIYKYILNMYYST
jgi:hypothetical protein